MRPVQTYGTVHQLPDEDAERCLKQAATFADHLATVFPKAVWVQMTRMNENEAELEPFTAYGKTGGKAAYSKI